MSRILDKSFKYVPAAKTNIAKTFARIRRELEGGKPQPTPPNVTNLKRKTA